MFIYIYSSLPRLHTVQSLFVTLAGWLLRVCVWFDVSLILVISNSLPKMYNDNFLCLFETTVALGYYQGLSIAHTTRMITKSIAARVSSALHWPPSGAKTPPLSAATMCVCVCARACVYQALDSSEISETWSRKRGGRRVVPEITIQSKLCILTW